MPYQKEAEIKLKMFEKNINQYNSQYVSTFSIFIWNNKKKHQYKFEGQCKEITKRDTSFLLSLLFVKCYKIRLFSENSQERKVFQRKHLEYTNCDLLLWFLGKSVFGTGVLTRIGYTPVLMRDYVKR